MLSSIARSFTVRATTPARRQPIGTRSFWSVLARDFDRNGRELSVGSFVRALLVPDRFGALTWIRLYQLCDRRRLPTYLPYRMLLHVHGLEIDRDVAIGPGLYMPHPRGVLFAEGTRIGADCAVYGTVRFLKNPTGTPHVGDYVFLGDGARVLGCVEVGSGATIGAGAVVTRDVPPGATAVGVPARVIDGARSGRGALRGRRRRSE